MIEAELLSKRYGDRLAVDRLSFQVRPGRVTGFVGPNGAGKSTTIRMVLGLDAQTSGRVTVNSMPYARLRAPLREVGSLLDARAVHGGRTARGHLLFLARSNGLPAGRVDEVLDLVGLAEVAGRRAKGFSLGMAQRLGIAAALLGDPGILLLDEPVNGLDPEGIRWIRGMLRRLAPAGRVAASRPGGADRERARRRRLARAAHRLQRAQPARRVAGCGSGASARPGAVRPAAGLVALARGRDRRRAGRPVGGLARLVAGSDTAGLSARARDGRTAGSAPGPGRAVAADGRGRRRPDGTAPGRVGSPDLLEIAGLAGTVLIASGSLRALADTRRRLAEQTSISEAERHRRALLEERARIARELHDVVAHHMSVIAIQAEAAPYRVADAPSELTNSFGAIRANALALTELRRVLGVLRDDRVEDRAPQPTLDRLGDLADNGRAGGLVVTTRVTGAVRPLPPGVELSAYRIVQEALSNAMRHAPGSPVQVDVRHEADAVAVHVTNGPPRTAPTDAPAAAGGGHGVLGMRERASMLGADLVAGPGADGGYAVTAVLPTSGSPAP